MNTASDPQQDERYRHLDTEVGGLKMSVSRLDAAVGDIRTDIGILSKGYESLRGELTTGFTLLRADFKEAKAEPPRMGVSMLISLIGSLAVGVGAFWVAVNLLFSPLHDNVQELKKDLEHHESMPGHSYSMAEIPMLKDAVSRITQNQVKTSEELKASDLKLDINRRDANLEQAALIAELRATIQKDQATLTDTLRKSDVLAVDMAWIKQAVVTNDNTPDVRELKGRLDSFEKMLEKIEDKSSKPATTPITP